ncbi:SCO family protein [Colwellia sp. KU-HH00111]|uniref:SCO family protein n=1 Tax=Colwellia sp. KU-HH00111 TaxID=3127652 RepID=UPI003108BF1E
MKHTYIYVIGFIAAILGAWFFQKATQLPQPEHALYYQHARDIKPFELIDHNGDPFTKAKLKGKWSLVFFGYTSCPDVCPTTLQNLGYIYDELKVAAHNSQILLVSVDPQRDTQEKLSQYIAYFNAEFIALRAGHDVLFPFARNLGLMYAISGEGEGYLVDHSASLVLINPEGKIAAIFKPEQEVGKVVSIDSDKLLSDYQKIVALY